MEIRLLKADEIEVRVQSYNAATKKAVFLLYKDARCDMKILDETFGIDGWEREHHLIDGKLFCTVKIWSEKRNCWISKQDVGTESNTEKEKGQASDSFKRACFNIGIGRELYSSPMVSIQCTDKDVYNGKCSLKLTVAHIDYDENREICELILVDRFGNERFNWRNSIVVPSSKQSYIDKGAGQFSTMKDLTSTLTDKQVNRLLAIGKAAGQSAEVIKSVAKKDYKVDELNKLSKKDYDALCERLEKAKK